MEVVAPTAATAFVKLIGPKLFNFLDANQELRKNLERDINYIKTEFEMISAIIEQDNQDGGGNVHMVWITAVRELAHAIEDCIDRFMHHVRMAEAGAGWLHRAIHRAKTAKARTKFAAAIQVLKKISRDIKALRETYSSSSSSSGASFSGPLSSELIDTAATDDDTDSTESGPVPVGMDTPRDELLGLIHQQQQLKVITIVGFHGIGKSLLAKHVYCTTESQYKARAWVSVTEVGGTEEDVLKDILRQLGHLPLPTNDRRSKLRASIKECIGTKRFFIVLDDMHTAANWHQIKVAFKGLSGRFLVTTAIQRVAKTCSSSALHDHVYAMKTLADKDSRMLFFKEAFEDEDPPPDAEELGSEALKKCDGLPLALVTTARFLKSSGDSTPREWARLCANLGTHLEKEEMFARMRQVLVHSYTSLGSQDVRTLLLYLGTYPSGRPIRRSSLIRRWLAEGLFPGDATCSALDAAISNFSKLVDRSIIQPIDSNSAEAKTFHTHGMMMEFVMRKSMSENFITLLYNQQSTAPLPTNIRRLSLYHTSAREAVDLSLVRSVTIFGKPHQSVLDFSKYELLRVLDLEECNERLGHSHLLLICTKLLLLRYLCLGAAVTAKELPKKIKKLRFLETLDVRGTQIEILPTQVMKLPDLLHIFGKFKLQQGVGERRIRKLQGWLKEKSKLETLAGFVVDNNKSMGFAQLMDHMKQLTKVKIWCESTADTGSSNFTDLSNAVKGFIERSTNTSNLSLSLSFNDKLSKELFMNLPVQKDKDCSYYLGSLKLQGINICSLPPFVAMLDRLTKLCLSSPGHQLSLSQDVLAALSSLHGLKCLKLIAAQLDKVVIAKDTLRSLLRLSIVVESMIEVEIQEEALASLKSLGLHCKDLAVFSSMLATQSLEHLEEIAVHQEVGDKTQYEWIEAAKNHPRRPKVLFVEKKIRKEPSVQRY